jgi:hypothetical protein
MNRRIAEYEPRFAFLNLDLHDRRLYLAVSTFPFIVM